MNGFRALYAFNPLLLHGFHQANIARRQIRCGAFAVPSAPDACSVRTIFCASSTMATHCAAMHSHSLTICASVMNADALTADAPSDSNAARHPPRTRSAVTLVLGGQRYRVRKGDSFSYKPSEQHYLMNTGKTPATVLWVCTPPNF